MRIPILVFDKTYIKDVTTEYGLVYIVDEKMINLANELYELYESFMFDHLTTGCSRFLSGAKTENKVFYKTLECYFNN